MTVFRETVKLVHKGCYSRQCSESGLDLFQGAPPFLSEDGVHCGEGHRDSMTTPSSSLQSVIAGYWF